MFFPQRHRFHDLQTSLCQTSLSTLKGPHSYLNGDKEGIILEAETGDFLGNHRGFWFYTIGQRQGLHLLGGPWYVVEKDTKNNVVFVSRNYYSIDKGRRVFRVGSLLVEIRQCLASSAAALKWKQMEMLRLYILMKMTKCFSVCAKSLQFAAMQDKTKLGKPVKPCQLLHLLRLSQERQVEKKSLSTHETEEKWCSSLKKSLEELKTREANA
ncbi:hypothetical protein DY000_02010343 [Brassica cretica]|uniref:tRNA-specific 2-thiouridylase MnmA-like central domain-containing protein n=1 Tax=Brassica cretica TaxID=69181 RepID=A0ABQ7C142_BRACR|nr:hypothetical protein DY000_02010343 [Brassica cretica]